MECKNGFLIFVDVHGELCCIRVSDIHMVCEDIDESIHVHFCEYGVRTVHVCEAIAVTKIIDMISNS